MTCITRIDALLPIQTAAYALHDLHAHAISYFSTFVPTVKIK